jgi:hypothetical protein
MMDLRSIMNDAPIQIRNPKVVRAIRALASAQREGQGLLFKGDDFPKTDVIPVLI